MEQITVENCFIDDIKWSSGATALFKPGKSIEIWQVNTAAFEADTSGFLNLLDHEELLKSAKFHFKKDSLSYIISHGALRLLLGKYLQKEPSSLTFDRALNGKPFLNGEPDLHFNISHSGERTLIAIANSEVGADVEKINTDFDFSSLLSGNFSQDEISYIQTGQEAHFFKLWTRKEALAKLRGKGLDDDLHLLPANDGLNVVSTALVPATGNLLINSFKLNGDYYCSIAGEAHVEQLSFYDFNYAFYQILVADVFPR